MTSPPGEITELLRQVSDGNRAAEAQLVPLVYDELRHLAACYMRRERPDHTLQPTALVHEAYLKLVDQKGTSWQSRAHFYGVAAHLMRRILDDHAREAKAAKRAGGYQKIPLDTALVYAEEKSSQLIAIDEALNRLAENDPRQSRVVELRFFGGRSEEEIAEILEISVRTVKRDWRLAKAWLYVQLSKK
ncbi:MAG: sigma-70 family RNA polymerase sigma factor [Acidobacteriia bacterium]|nr:sigma-70 family RNA polymerase sigma factor [Terriglobia bacterium]